MPQQRGRGLNKKQRAQVKQIATAPMERKRFPIYKQGYTVTSTHTVFDEFAVPRGDSEEQRDGDVVKITSGFIRGHIVGSDATNVVRFTAIRWKPNTVPLATDVYDNTVIGANGAMYSQFNHRRRSDFVVLADRFYNMESATGDIQKMFTFKLRSQPKSIFNGVNTTGTNKIYLIWSSDSTAVSHPTITYRGEFNYIDA